MKRKSLRNNQKGITLIALVITIIVLLILAGVAISQIAGNNSILNKAQNASEATKAAEEESNVQLAVTNLVASHATDTLGKFTFSELQTAMAGIGIPNSSVGVAEGGTESAGPWVVTGTVGSTPKTWTVTANGGVTAGGTGTPVTPTPTGTPLTIGATVNYSTTLNGQTLNSWKVLKSDANYTYIILGDYLPNAAVSDTMKSTYNLANGSGDYSIKSTTNRTDLINAMSTKSNWDSLLTGTLNGTTAVNETRTANVWAMGAPTLDLWVSSWNASYSSDTLYTRNVTSSEIDNSNFYAEGYAIGTAEPVTSTYVDLSGKTGYSNTLYYPHDAQWNSCNGYWLASPSARGDSYVMIVRYDGSVGYGAYSYANRAFRPVVCLPTNILN